MGDVVFVAVRRFDPADPGWEGYVRRSQLTHLREVVSLDHLLCPSVIELIDEDWDHNVHSDFETDYFRDVDYLIQRVAQIPNVQILAIAKEPIAGPTQTLADERFAFMGYDLVERDGGISAITNCGGFRGVFSSSDLNECGLIPDAAKAYQVRDLLAANYPDEHHANCNVWAIWRHRS